MWPPFCPQLLAHVGVNSGLEQLGPNMAPGFWLLGLPVALLWMWWVRELSDSPVADNLTYLAVEFDVEPAQVIQTLRSTRDPGL